MVAADVRELLQSRFGNAGHGFCLPVKPWAWYDHRYVTINGSGWIVERVTNSAASDGLYGLGGVGYWGNPGAHAELTFDKPGHTQVEVSFLRRPDGGLFRVTSGGQPLGETDTAGPDTVEAFARFAVPAAANGVRLDVTSGTVRLFGWSLRRDRPGIVYSSLGLNGAFIDVIGRRFRSGHLEALWRHYQPDLIILNYGTNGLIGENMADEWFVGEVRHAFRRAKAAAPAGTPILVMSPMDKGWRDSTGEITTSEGYQQMIRLLHQVSAEEGLPFFDTFEAMGGPGTMGRWYNGEPRMVGSDFIHPTPGGGRTVAKLFVDALLRSYRKSRSGGGITQ